MQILSSASRASDLAELKLQYFFISGKWRNGREVLEMDVIIYILQQAQV